MRVTLANNFGSSPDFHWAITGYLHPLFNKTINVATSICLCAHFLPTQLNLWKLFYLASSQKFVAWGKHNVT